MINYQLYSYDVDPLKYQVITQHSISVTTRSEFLTQILMKVKVADLEGLLSQKRGMIIMKVKVEDPEDLGGSSNIQEYMLLSC